MRLDGLLRPSRPEEPLRRDVATTTTNYELVDTIFSPDVRWEGSPDDPWGSAVGREAFIELFKGFQKQMDGRCLGHNITNPIITFDDDTHAMATAPVRSLQKVVRRASGAGVGFLEQGLL